MAKWYGSVDNRIDEGKNFTKDGIIKVGTDITMYSWSDRHCYYVTRVVNQTNVFVKPYRVVADQEKAGGMGHQNWVYFKTAKEEREYMMKYHPERYNKDEKIYEDKEEEWEFKYNTWKRVVRIRKDVVEKYAKGSRDEWDAKCIMSNMTDSQKKKYEEGKEVKVRLPMEKVSFGIRDYYFDWEF